MTAQLQYWPVKPALSITWEVILQSPLSWLNILSLIYLFMTPERSIGSCNWSRDCQSYQSCKYIYDASCVCLFGQCVVKPIPFMGIGTQCRQYTDCDCRYLWYRLLVPKIPVYRDTPEFCFCKHGTCEKTRWECHEKRDCARLSKCRNKDCVCSGRE